MKVSFFFCVFNYRVDCYFVFICRVSAVTSQLQALRLITGYGMKEARSLIGSGFDEYFYSAILGC